MTFPRSKTSFQIKLKIQGKIRLRVGKGKRDNGKSEENETWRKKEERRRRMREGWKEKISINHQYMCIICMIYHLKNNILIYVHDKWCWGLVESIQLWFRRLTLVSPVQISHVKCCYVCVSVLIILFVCLYSPSFICVNRAPLYVLIHVCPIV